LIKTFYYELNAGGLHSSDSVKQIGGLWSRPAWAKKLDFISKIITAKRPGGVVEVWLKL
jgi:hypothetical protein